MLVAALPVLPAQAERLIAQAERAPHGKGAQTLTDTVSRRTRQIAPERIRISGRRGPAPARRTCPRASPKRRSSLAAGRR